jgi:hypothetical protein
MPRPAPEVRRAATRRIKEMIDVVARQSPDWGIRQVRHADRHITAVATFFPTDSFIISDHPDRRPRRGPDQVEENEARSSTRTFKSFH